MIEKYEEKVGGIGGNLGNNLISIRKMGLAMLAAVESASVESNHKKPTHSQFSPTTLFQSHFLSPSKSIKTTKNTQITLFLTPNLYLVLVGTPYPFQATTNE